MFHIKNLGVLNAHLMLEKILVAVRARFGLDVITSGFRPGDPRCHGTVPELRGADLRCRDLLIGNHIAAWVNANWQYDPKRPDMKCAKCHKGLSGAYHLHFQVHPNTIRR